MCVGAHMWCVHVCACVFVLVCVRVCARARVCVCVCVCVCVAFFNYQGVSFFLSYQGERLFEL